MTAAEVLTRRLYASLRRSPENKKELDKLAERMMAEHREMTRRMLRGRGGE